MENSSTMIKSAESGSWVLLRFISSSFAGEPQNAVQRFGLINRCLSAYTPAGSACRRHQGDLSLGMQAAVDSKIVFSTVVLPVPGEPVMMERLWR